MKSSFSKALHPADLQLSYKWAVILSKMNSFTGVADMLIKFSQIFLQYFVNIFKKYLDHLKMWYLTKAMINRANQISMFRDLEISCLGLFSSIMFYDCNTSLSQNR